MSAAAEGLKRRRVSKMSDEQKAGAKLAKQTHLLDCSVCAVESGIVPGDVVKFTCDRCTQQTVPGPVLAEKQTKKKLKYDFGRGWWRKILFTAMVEGEKAWFSRGERITEAEYLKVEAEQNAPDDTPKRGRGRPRKNGNVPRKVRVGFGRGWHLKKDFTAPDGTKYKFGIKQD